MGAYGGPRIVRDGLLLCIDSANRQSYPESGTTWYDIIQKQNATLSGPTYSNDVMTFDGSNDSITFGSNFSIDVANGFTFWVIWELPTQSSGAWNYFLYHNPSGNHKYEFGQYGTSANTFHYKDNISYNGTATFASMASTGYSVFAFGTTSDGKTCTSVNGAARTIKEPGSNSYWATAPTADMVFNSLFTGAGNYLSSNVKMLALYTKSLSDQEIEQNYNYFKARR